MFAVVLALTTGFRAPAQPFVEASERPPHRLTITVLDAVDGHPIEGATFAVAGPFLRSMGRADRGDGVTTDQRGVAVLSIAFPQGVPNFNLSVMHSNANYAARLVTWTAPPEKFVASFPTNYTVRLTHATTVGGFVRDERGNAIPGAQVTLWGGGQSVGEPQATHVQERSIIPGDESGASRTDQSGFWTRNRFPVDLENATIEVIRPGGAYTYFGTSSGMGQGLVELEALRRTNAVLTLPEGISVRGMVVDERGQPVSGVRLKERGGRMSRTQLFTNQADGRFELTHRSGSQFLLAAESPRHAPKWVVVTLDETASDVRIVLPKLSPARLRIVDENDQPVEGAYVQAVEWRNPGQMFDWNSRSDAEGRVVWTNAPAGPAVVMISAPRLANRTARLTPREDEHVVRMRQEPEKSTRLQIKAVEEGTGRAIAGFTVGRTPNYSQTFIEVGKAGADGIFRSTLGAEELRFQQFTLSVRAEGYAAWMSEEQFMLGEGDLDLTVQLKQGRPPAGVVLRPDGQPAANARVVLNPTEQPVYSYRPGELSPSGQSVVTHTAGSDGSFRFTGADQDDRLIMAHPAGFAALAVGQLPSSGQVRLQPWARVEGVLRSGAKPLAGERVSIRTPLVWMHPDGFHFTYSVTTDKSGRFVFTNIPPGEHVLYRLPRVTMGPNTESHRKPIIVKAGETKQVDYTLGGRVITGYVDTEAEVDWSLDAQILATKQAAPTPEPYFSAIGGPAAYRRTRRAQATSPAFLDYERKRQQFQLIFDKEGGFRADDVPAGTYELRLRVSEPPPNSNPTGSRRYYGERAALGTLVKEIIVPPGDPGTEVDLGTFEMAVKLPASITRLPPVSFQASTLDGKAFDLASHRGQPTLLVFWAGWAPRSDAKLAEFHNAVTPLGAKATLVTINLDDDPAAARLKSQALGNGWKHARLEGAARFEVTERLAIDTLPVSLLLDADGSVIARDLSAKRLGAVLNRLDKKSAKK